MDRGARVGTRRDKPHAQRTLYTRGAIAFLAILIAAAATRGWLNNPGPRASGALVQQAYVWQRAWTDGVRASVDCGAEHVDGVAVWAAEIEWLQRTPRVVRGDVDFEQLRRLGIPVGLVLRIGPYTGPFAETGEPADTLASTAGALLRKAAAGGVTACEIQVDFDCATSKLDGYRLWIEAIRRRVDPAPVVITALPSWLNNPAFERLAAASDGFVLQVHSLERPRGPDEPMRLCDPAAARRAVEKAGKIGVPFRVALATYGYFVGFDRNGALIGLQADGPSLTWPADAQVRALRADPAATADLVRGWRQDRPASMQGLIWYRLPTDADLLNWRWPTLAAVMAGRVPRGTLTVDARRPEAGLVELDLVNIGDADTPLPAEVTATWGVPRLVAGDALAGFELDEAGPARAVFRPHSEAASQWIAAGQRRVLGWLRFEIDTEVEIRVTPSQH